MLRKRMMLKPEHEDALPLLGWHAMREERAVKVRGIGW